MGIITDSWQVMSEGYLASLKTFSLFACIHDKPHGIFS